MSSNEGIKTWTRKTSTGDFFYVWHLDHIRSQIQPKAPKHWLNASRSNVFVRAIADVIDVTTRESQTQMDPSLSRRRLSNCPVLLYKAFFKEHFPHIPFPKLLIIRIRAQHSPLCSLNWNQFIKETISPRIESPTVDTPSCWPLSGWVERVASRWPGLMKGLDVRLQKCRLTYIWTRFRLVCRTWNTWLTLHRSVSPRLFFSLPSKVSLSSVHTHVYFPVHSA